MIRGARIRRRTRAPRKIAAPKMKVTLHPHAVQRLAERGATRDEVIYTVKHGKSAPAKFDRTNFTHTFAYHGKWLGTSYRRKTIEAFASEDDDGNWLVVTIVVKFF